MSHITQKPSKEEFALGSFLSAMHESKMDGRAMRAAMLKALGMDGATLAQPIKEIVVNADYREMWAQQVQMNQQLTAALAQPEPVVLIGKVESAAVACRGFHVVLAEGATMPKIGDLILTAAKKPAKGGAL